MLKFNSNSAVSSKFAKTLNQSFDHITSTHSESAFYQAPDRIHLFEQSQNLSNELQKKYTHFVVIGIGGSSMGARALVELAQVQHLTFLDNVDTSEFNHVFNKHKQVIEKTAFIVVSKSGSTIEILWNYSALQQEYLQSTGINIVNQSYFITELAQNPLSEFAKNNQRPILEVPLDIGGRFSVLTPVGLLIASLCGFNLEKLRSGALAALREKNQVTELASLFLESFEKNENISLFWFYHSHYRWFGGWIQQLWAESLGKKNTVTLEPAPHFSTPLVAIGSTDQHSILQQVAHGQKNKFVLFFDFLTSHNSKLQVKNVLFKDIEFMINRNYGELIASQALATHQALKANNVSNLLIQCNDTDRDVFVGYLFMFFQLLVSTIGHHEKINPFDQPGVTLGKEITLEILKNKKGSI